MRKLVLILVIPLFSGCMSGRIKGGTLTHRSALGSATKQVQTQDPKNSTTLSENSERTEHIPIPAGSSITIGTNTFTLSSNSDYTITIKDSVQSVQGAAQKNVLGETIAKLSSLKWLTYFGVVLFLFGIATAVYPPLKVLVGGSLTTSAAIAGGGLLLTVLPVLVVGHELLILGAVLGGVALYYFAHRHGSIAGELRSVKNFVKDKLPLG